MSRRPFIREFLPGSIYIKSQDDILLEEVLVCKPVFDVTVIFSVIFAIDLGQDKAFTVSNNQKCLLILRIHPDIPRYRVHFCEENVGI